MISKIIGMVLLVVGVFGIIVLLTYGGPIFPHVIGPTILAIAGGALIALKRRTHLRA